MAPVRTLHGPYLGARIRVGSIWDARRSTPKSVGSRTKAATPLAGVTDATSVRMCQ
jgi:hypothetical protein